MRPLRRALEVIVQVRPGGSHTCCCLQSKPGPPFSFSSRGTLRLSGDALGVLQGAVLFRAQDAMINAMVTEMALLFAPKGVEFSAMHIWSENNVLADTLSRLAEGAVVPPVLIQVARSVASRDGFYIIGWAAREAADQGREDGP